MTTLEEYRKAGEELYSRLHLATYPVAVTYVKDEAEFTGGMMRPSSNGQKLSLCQAFTYSRRWGFAVAMSADDNFCVPASALHRWVDISDDEFMQSQVLQGWHSGREAEARRFERIKSVIGGKKTAHLAGYTGLISSPLHTAPVEPHTVLVFGTGENITHVIHALTYDGEHYPVSSFEGFGETCFKGGLIPYVTGVPQVVVPGMGDRAFSGVFDSEIAIGFPARLLFHIVGNLFKSGGRMNLGHPAKVLLPMGLNEKLTPGFSYLRDRLDEKKKG